MGRLTLEEFADRLDEMMGVMIKAFLRQGRSQFYKVKVTMPQFIILKLLSKMGQPKMSDLARSVNVTTAAMTGIIERLVRDRYVVRASDPKDRRIIKVRLTDKGEKLVKGINRERRKVIIDVFGKITQDEREEYLRILGHIKSHIE